MTKTYDVVAIGNAIVDVLSFCDDGFITAQEMRKGTMQLIDAERAEQLYNAMGQATEVSGGSAANTLAGMADLGAKTAFIGKVNADELARIFIEQGNGRRILKRAAQLGIAASEWQQQPDFDDFLACKGWVVAAIAWRVRGDRTAACGQGLRNIGCTLGALRTRWRGHTACKQHGGGNHYSGMFPKTLAIHQGTL
jgi:hypothetical protein